MRSFWSGAFEIVMTSVGEKDLNVHKDIGRRECNGVRRVLIPNGR